MKLEYIILILVLMQNGFKCMNDQESLETKFIQDYENLVNWRNISDWERICNKIRAHKNDTGQINCFPSFFEEFNVVPVNFRQNHPTVANRTFLVHLLACDCTSSGNTEDYFWTASIEGLTRHYIIDPQEQDENHNFIWHITDCLEFVAK